jgi:hypothetical protein
VGGTTGVEGAVVCREKGWFSAKEGARRGGDGGGVVRFGQREEGAEGSGGDFGRGLDKLAGEEVVGRLGYRREDRLVALLKVVGEGLGHQMESRREGITRRDEDSTRVVAEVKEKKEEGK